MLVCIVLIGYEGEWVDIMTSLVNIRDNVASYHGSASQRSDALGTTVYHEESRQQRFQWRNQAQIANDGLACPLTMSTRCNCLKWACKFGRPGVPERLSQEWYTVTVLNRVSIGWIVLCDMGRHPLCGCQVSKEKPSAVWRVTFMVWEVDIGAKRPKTIPAAQLCPVQHYDGDLNKDWYSLAPFVSMFTFVERI